MEEPAAISSKATVGIGNRNTGGTRSEPVQLSHIQKQEDDLVKTEIEELDMVLGGGIVPGSMVLVGGDPGIGKSTLLLQVCRELTARQHKVLYIPGEESLRQIKLRASRDSTRFCIYQEKNLCGRLNYEPAG